MSSRRHVDSVGLPQPASKGRLNQTVRFNGSNAEGMQLPADFSPVGLCVGETHSLHGIVARNLEPSLRANGSRECAPDDRLREAIHLAA